MKVTNNHSWSIWFLLRLLKIIHILLYPRDVTNNSRKLINNRIFVGSGSGVNSLLPFGYQINEASKKTTRWWTIHSLISTASQGTSNIPFPLLLFSSASDLTARHKNHPLEALSIWNYCCWSCFLWTNINETAAAPKRFLPDKSSIISC